MAISEERLSILSKFLRSQIAASNRPPAGHVQINNEEAGLCADALEWVAQEYATDEPREYDLKEAVRIAGLWRAGKLIGADHHGVRDALLAEVERRATAFQLEVEMTDSLQNQLGDERKIVAAYRKALTRIWDLCETPTDPGEANALTQKVGRIAKNTLGAPPAANVVNIEDLRAQRLVTHLQAGLELQSKSAKELVDLALEHFIELKPTECQLMMELCSRVNPGWENQP